MRRGWPIFLLAALAAALMACQGTTSPPGTTSPTATAGPTTSPSSTAEPAPSQLVYREFGASSDTIWRFDPTRPEERQALATVDHREGWGIFASVAPQDDALAYTVLPEEVQSAEREAQAFVFPIGGSPRLLVRGVDLRSTPLWSPDGRFLYLRRNSGTTISLLEVGIDAGEEREVVSIAISSEDVCGGLFPIGLSGDAQVLYYAHIAADCSTALAGLHLATGETTREVQASNQIARDYALSPDEQTIAFTVGGRAFLADLDSAQVTPVESEFLGGTEQRQPVWRPDGALTLGQQLAGDEPSPAVVIDPVSGQGMTLPPPERGFDDPLSWSPDGKLLAVRSIDGPSQSLVLITGEGQRLLVGQGPDFMWVGWL